MLRPVVTFGRPMPFIPDGQEKTVKIPIQVRAGQSLGESSYEEKASILKLLASNDSLVYAGDVSIRPTYRKPFDIIAEGLSRLNWLPGRDSNPRPIG
jgi:hypothetical protein